MNMAYISLYLRDFQAALSSCQQLSRLCAQVPDTPDVDMAKCVSLGWVWIRRNKCPPRITRFTITMYAAEAYCSLSNVDAALALLQRYAGPDSSSQHGSNSSASRSTGNSLLGRSLSELDCEEGRGLSP